MPKKYGKCKLIESSYIGCPGGSKTEKCCYSCKRAIDCPEKCLNSPIRCGEYEASKYYEFKDNQIASMQADAQSGMKIREIAQKYGTSTDCVRYRLKKKV